ncbi:MAG: hypothetical protein HYZ73_05100 [Elusimicrobia bacterium]|nr:hypothetical protein [Elusimicrobiota bacterium]
MENQETIAIQERRWQHPGGKLIEEGPESLTQAELLAIVIGSGVPGKPAIDLANEILDEYIGLYGIHQKRATVADLAKIKGLKRAKAERVLAAIKLGRLLFCRQVERLKPEVSGWDEAELLSALLGAGIAGRSSRQIAQEVIERYGSIASLGGCDMGELQKIKGLDSVKIIRIAATLEIAFRLHRAFSM